jgi:hypothetical protein
MSETRIGVQVMSMSTYYVSIFYLGSDLVPALAGLNMNDFTHVGRWG